MMGPQAWWCHEGTVRQAFGPCNITIIIKACMVTGTPAGINASFMCVGAGHHHPGGCHHLLLALHAPVLVEQVMLFKLWACPRCCRATSCSGQDAASVGLLEFLSCACALQPTLDVRQFDSIAQ